MYIYMYVYIYIYMYVYAAYEHIWYIYIWYVAAFNPTTNNRLRPPDVVPSPNAPSVAVDGLPMSMARPARRWSKSGGSTNKL